MQSKNNRIGHYNYHTYKAAVRENIKKLRMESGYSVKLVASEMGVSAKAIYDYEKGTKVPSIEVLVKYSVFFQVKFEKILRFSTTLKFSKRQGILVKNNKSVQLLECFHKCSTKQKDKILAYIGNI